MEEKIARVLDALDPAALTYTEWVTVGMALKESGYPVEVWDAWSSRDPAKYHDGECERKWSTFGNYSGTKVTVGSIVQIAREHGVQLDRALDWDDWISYNADEAAASSEDSWDPAEDLVTYLNTLFDPGEIVGYSVEAFRSESGKWLPTKGIYHRTAGEIVDKIRHYNGELRLAIGDWNRAAGAWIRFNPLDGAGVGNENVTAYRYALVESDDLPLNEQEAAYRRYELPIAAMVYSGGKSVHAIVRIDAPDKAEYDRRVAFLYSYLGKLGISIDRQNKNPSRLSRMPGVTRGDKRQKLLAVNIGKASWADWVDWVQGAENPLPEIVSIADEIRNPPDLPPAILGGVLRRGRKLLIAGESKSGKSFLLMELCIALSIGGSWLGHTCNPCRVLYIDLEIEKDATLHRFADIADAMGLPREYAVKNIDMAPWRGCAATLDKLAPLIIRRAKERRYDAIVLDPIYKVIIGDENSASDMGAFCNQFDRICAETGAAMIYCHHFSKGAQGGKKAIDRASGSGVFGRDPDAVITMTGIPVPEATRNRLADETGTAWRVEYSLREFAPVQPKNIWFRYPLHTLDDTGTLERLLLEGDPSAPASRSGRRAASSESRLEELDTAFDALSGMGEPVTVHALAEYLEKADRTIRERIKGTDKYVLISGTVKKSIM